MVRRFEMRRPRGRKTWILTSTAIVTFAAGGVAWWQMGSGPREARAQAEQASEEDKEIVKVPVALAAVESRDLPERFNATGSLEARRNVELIARVTGQITHLAVEEGAWVGEGEVLVEIDDREQALLVEEARVRMVTAEQELARRKDMAARGLETDRALEEARQTFEVNQAQYELAQVRLDDHVVRAPFAGRVTVRHVELGQTVQNGARVADLADTSPMQVRLFLPERVVKRLAVGQPVEIRPDVSDDVALIGIVERIAPVVDPATSTVKVTLRVDDAEGMARAGSFVRARITTDLRSGAISVPKKALVAEAGATYVFVAEADSVRRVPVSTGYSDDSHIEVLEGVALGDHVVVIGQGGLRHGSRIEELPGPDALKSKAEPAASEDDGEALAHRS